LSETDNGIDDQGYAVFCGLDVGKAVHHACALNRAGKRLHDKALPNDEAALIEVFEKLAVHGRVLMIVDQPASIGALPIAVARSLNIEVRLSARAGDAPHRRPAPRRGQDRRPRRLHHRRRRPHHAPHPSSGRHRRRHPR